MACGNEPLLTEIYVGRVKTYVSEASTVVVQQTRDYGCVSVRISGDGTIHVESQDGNGEVLEQTDLKIDDLVCDGKADEDASAAQEEGDGETD